MADTVRVDLTLNTWVNLTAGLKTGLITNNSNNSIRYVQAISKPSDLNSFGHVLHPQQNFYFNLVGGDSVWAYGQSYGARVALTSGLGLTKHLNFTKDFYFDVSVGNIHGFKSINRFGSNPSVPNATEEDVWRAGGTLNYLQAADTMDLFSTNVGDNQAGAGARSLAVFGLDGNFNEIFETRALHPTDGTIAVTTVNQYIRIWLAYVVDVGVYGGANLGDIIIADSSTASTQAFIEANEGQSDGTHYTVPAGKTMYMLKPTIVTDTGKSVDVHMISRPGADIVTAPFKSTGHRQHWEGLTQPFADPYRIFKKFEEKTDVWFKCFNNSGSASAIGVDYDMIIVDN